MILKQSKLIIYSEGPSQFINEIVKSLGIEDNTDLENKIYKNKSDSLNGCYGMIQEEIKYCEILKNIRKRKVILNDNFKISIKNRVLELFKNFDSKSFLIIQSNIESMFSDPKSFKVDVSNKQIIFHEDYSSDEIIVIIYGKICQRTRN